MEVIAMLSDAELREYEIQACRLRLIRYESDLPKLLAKKDDMHISLTLDCIRFTRERLEQLEAEAADDLEMIRKLKDGE